MSFYKHWLKSGWVWHNVGSGIVHAGVLGTSQGTMEKSCLNLYLNTFFLENPNPWWPCYRVRQWTTDGFLSWLTEQDKTGPHSSQNKRLATTIQSNQCVWPSPSLPYQAQWQSAQRAFDQGLLQKAVLYQNFPGFGSWTTRHLVRAIVNSIKTYRHPLSENPVSILGMWQNQSANKDNHAWGVLAATPELLFCQRDQRVYTCALAGTKAIQAEDTPHLNAEHNFVIQDLQHSLSALGRVQIHKTQWCRLPHLQHLKTSMTVDLYAPCSFSTLLNTVHPSSALGTFPKARFSNTQWQWLQEIERLSQVSRSFFGGPIALIDSDLTVRSRCMGLIRGIEWQGDAWHICTGGGVVFGSCIDAEWKEIVLKWLSVKNQFGL